MKGTEKAAALTGELTRPWARYLHASPAAVAPQNLEDEASRLLGELAYLLQMKCCCRQLGQPPKANQTGTALPTQAAWKVLPIGAWSPPSRLWEYK